jgi:hypothetical protein
LFNYHSKLFFGFLCCYSILLHASLHCGYHMHWSLFPLRRDKKVWNTSFSKQVFVGECSNYILINQDFTTLMKKNLQHHLIYVWSLVYLMWHNVIANAPHDRNTSDNFRKGENPINIILPSRSPFSQWNEHKVYYLHTNTGGYGYLEVLVDTSWYIASITPFRLSVVEFSSAYHLHIYIGRYTRHSN